MRFLDATPNGALAMDLLSTLPFAILTTFKGSTNRMPSNMVRFLDTTPLETSTRTHSLTFPFFVFGT